MGRMPPSGRCCRLGTPTATPAPPLAPGAWCPGGPRLRGPAASGLHSRGLCHAVHRLILDEFPDILALNNYPQVESVVALFQALLQGQARVCYVVAGSVLSLMEQLFLGADSPLLVHFQLETVGLFGREDSCDLTRRRLLSQDPSPSPEVLAAVYHVTRAHPLCRAGAERHATAEGA